MCYDLFLCFKEKECEKIDDKSAESSSEYETDEEWEEQRRKVQANMEKDNVSTVSSE